MRLRNLAPCRAPACVWRAVFRTYCTFFYSLLGCQRPPALQALCLCCSPPGALNNGGQIFCVLHVKERKARHVFTTSVSYALPLSELPAVPPKRALKPPNPIPLPRAVHSAAARDVLQTSQPADPSASLGGANVSRGGLKIGRTHAGHTPASMSFRRAALRMG